MSTVSIRPARPRWRWRLLVGPPTTILAVACASARTSLPARLQYETPFYEFYDDAPLPAAAMVAHIPVPEVPLQAPFPSLRRLIEGVNALLDSAGWSTPLRTVPRWRDEGPELYVGTAARWEAATSLPEEERARRRPPLVVAGWRPSARWRESLSEIATREGAEFVLIVDLGVSEYPLWQKEGLTLNVQLPLGTGYVLPVSWVHDLGTPVRVLQLKGALLGRDGRVLRAGAEGIVAKEPRLLPTWRGLLPFFTEDEIRRVMTEHRREELPGRPLVWRVALQNLVAHLLQRGDLVIQ